MIRIEGLRIVCSARTKTAWLAVWRGARFGAAVAGGIMLAVGFSILVVQWHQAKLAGPPVIDRKFLEEAGGMLAGVLLSAVYGALVGGLVYGVRALSKRPSNLESRVGDDESKIQNG